MNEQAKTALIRARTQLLLEHPFFGALALRLRLVEDESVRTLAVDGKSMFYNPTYVLNLEPAVQIAAVAHEVMHCVLDHMSRLNGRQHNRWNRACDFAVNPLLKEAGMELGKGWLYEASLAGKSADEIYNLLPPDEDGDGDPGQDDIRAGAADPQQKVDWQIAASQAAAVAAAAGKLPGYMERFLDELGKPQVNWREQLRNFTTAAAKNDFSWSRPQRHMLPYGVVLPGLYSESMGLCVAVSDDSGSVSNAILNALATEIDSIAAIAMPERLIHISCDAEINHVGEFGPGDTFKMVSKGGGGTDFRPPFAYVEEQGLKPACLIYLTDGYGPFPKLPPPYPVLWVMATDVIPPWGEYVRIEV